MSAAIAKYQARAAAVNSLLCIGLDSDPARIPSRFGGDVVAFNQWIIEQTHAYVCAYKPNSAFYEARGAVGWQELEATVAYLREQHPHIFTICDAKRADIGNTNAGYVTAIFDHMSFDAVTLNLYLGGEALLPFLEREDKASVILCRTSNVGAGELQDLLVEDRPLWQHVAQRAHDEWNRRSNVMLVAGATYPNELRTIRETVGDMPLLVPGVGAQGGDVEATVQAGMDRRGGGLIISASRSILYADDPATAARKLRDAINSAKNL